MNECVFIFLTPLINLIPVVVNINEPFKMRSEKHFSRISTGKTIQHMFEKQRQKEISFLLIFASVSFEVDELH